jgi:hypothetical protein
MKIKAFLSIRLVWVLFASLLFSVSTPLASTGVSNVTISGKIGYLDSATSTVVPLKAQRVYTGSGQNSLNLNFYTDNNGDYSISVPTGTDYSFSFDFIPALSDPLPGKVSINMMDLNFSQNEVMNVTIPAAYQVQVRIIDTNGSPLPGAKVFLGSGSNYGTFSQVDLSPYTGAANRNLTFEFKKEASLL